MTTLDKTIRDLIQRLPELSAVDADAIAIIVREKHPDASFPLIVHLICEILIEVHRSGLNLSKSARERLARVAAFRPFRE